MAAKIVPAPGVMPNGTIGATHRRVHCESCGYMSGRLTYRMAEHYRAAHNAEKHAR